MEKTETLRPRGTAVPGWPGASPGASAAEFPQQHEAPQLLDGAAAPAAQVDLAQRTRFRRQPPQMSLTWAEPDQLIAAASLSPDVVEVCGLPVTEFAFRLAELSSRLEAPVRYSGSPEAKQGLAVLALQSRMYEHLYLLQTSPDAVT